MTLRVAMVGAGYFSRFHLEGWAQVRGASVAALCDTDLSRARELADEFRVPHAFADVDEMLDTAKPDLFDIVTPPDSHLALTRRSASRDVPTICQKPLAPTLAEARQLVDEMGATPLIVHENFRFSPWYREARRLIDNGTLGTIHSVAFRLRPGDGQGSDAYLARQPYFQKMSRFLVHETAVHFIDTFRYLMGEVSAVTANLRRVNPAIAGEDAGYIVFDFEAGSSGLFDGNRLNEHNASDLRRTMGEMWLEGSNGVLRLDGAGLLFLKPHASPEGRHEYDAGTDTFAGGACALLQQHVVDYLQRGEVLENSGRDYLRNMQIVEAVYESSAQGRRINLSLSG